MDTDIFFLPPEILTLIVSYLDWESFCAVRTSSIFFFELTQNMNSSLNILHWNQIQWMTRKTKTLCESRVDIFLHHDLFIKSLIELEDVSKCYFTEYDRDTSPTRRSREPNMTYSVILTLLWKHLTNTYSIVDDIVNGRKVIADNFEILDFCIRR